MFKDAKFTHFVILFSFFNLSSMLTEDERRFLALAEHLSVDPPPAKMRRNLSVESALCRSLRPLLFSFESSDRCSSSPAMTASSEALHGCHELPTLSDTHISDMKFWLTVRSKDMKPSSINSVRQKNYFSFSCSIGSLLCQH